MNALSGTHATRRLLVPAVMTAVMVLVLCGLGTWQVYRLQWKLAILTQIAAAEQAPPVPLEAMPPGAAPTPYQKVSATGRFDYAKAALYGADVRDTKAGPTMGAYQLVPLERDGAPPILVERGWAPQLEAAPQGKPPQGKPLQDMPVGTVTVTGYVRPSESPHWFSPASDLQERRFYTLDTGAIGLSLGLPAPEPFVLVALGPDSTDSFPIPAQHLPQPPNNHLSYAVTWYGLAIAAIVVFVVWARKGSDQPASST
jgi:surfeit locus 1 family protein